MAELRGDDDLIADAGERISEQLLAGARAVDVGGIEEGDPAIEGKADGRTGLGFVGGSLGVGHAHAAQPLLRDEQGGTEECRAEAACVQGSSRNQLRAGQCSMSADDPAHAGEALSVPRAEEVDDLDAVVRI